MSEVSNFLKAQGWRVVDASGDLFVISINHIDIVRGMARLRRAFANLGVVLYPKTPAPVTRPCAWVEYDAATLRARAYLVINDSWMPRGRREIESNKRATATPKPADPITP